MSEIDYSKLLDVLQGGAAEAQIEALKTLQEIPADVFDKSKLPQFFKVLRSLVHEGEREVQYKARGTLDRLKDLTGLGDLALVLTDFLEEEDREAEPERPELVYGTIPYWLYELQSRDFRVRIKAIIELAKTRQRRIFEKLIEVQDQEEHEWVHATFSKYLGHFRQPESFERIVRYLDSRDNRVRANALEGLEFLADEGAVELVRPMLQDSDNRVRANAAKFLVRFDLPSVESALDAMLESKEEWMRDSATYILARVEFEGIEAFLERALQDPNPVIASKAARALARKGNPEAARGMLEEADGSRDERLAKAIEEALQQLG